MKRKPLTESKNFTQAMARLENELNLTHFPEKRKEEVRALVGTAFNTVKQIDGLVHVIFLTRLTCQE